MSTPQFPTEVPQYPEPSQATTALVFGILGLVLCGVLAPFAWVMGNRELAGIDSGLRDPANRGTAKASQVLGIIGTIFLVIGIIVGIGFLFLAVASVEIG